MSGFCVSEGPYLCAMKWPNSKIFNDTNTAFDFSIQHSYKLQSPSNIKEGQHRFQALMVTAAQKEPYL
jgi:hypothetical protein